MLRRGRVVSDPGLMASAESSNPSERQGVDLTQEVVAVRDASCFLS